MKLYTLLFILAFSNAFSQNTDDATIIKTILGNNSLSENVYAKQSRGYNQIEELLKRKQISNKHAPGIAIILKQNEAASIKEQIKRYREYEFPDHFIQNSKAISTDTLATYSSNKAKKWRKDFDRLIQLGDTVKINAFKNNRSYPCLDNWVNFLSKPIYFRDKKFCIVYHAKLCNLHQGAGGCDAIIFYRKENDAWNNYLEISIGCF